MKKFKTKWFKKWAEKHNLSDAKLNDAIERLQSGLGIVDLGSHLFKIRIEKAGKGKSGGFRTLIAYKFGKRSLFIFGFEKNDRDNIGSKELELYKEFSRTFMSHDESMINKLIESNAIFLLEENDEE